MEPLMLDSILAYHWMKEKGYFKTSSENIKDNLVFPDLPIKRVGNCYASSAMFVPEGAAFIQEDILNKTGSWKRGMAMHRPDTPYVTDTKEFRIAQIKVWLLATPYIDFYVNVTDDDKFFRLLTKVNDNHFLGAKHAVGFGYITKITFDDVKEDWSFMKDGIPTRPLPVELFKGKVKDGVSEGKSTYYPPYWFYQNQDDCYLPPVEQYTPQVSKSLFDSVEHELMAQLHAYQERNARTA
jgi:hypothetical protein